MIFQKTCYFWAIFGKRGAEAVEADKATEAAEADEARWSRRWPYTTKKCARHEKGLSWLILVAHESSRSNRGYPQHPQIVRLPRRRTLMIDPGHTWNVIYIARSNRGYLPTSPNIAPATQKNSYDWSWSHMKRHVQGATARNNAPASKKGLSWLILVTHENPGHTWNVIYTARSNRGYPPSANIALARKKDSHDWSWSHVKRHLHCAEQQRLPSNIAK